LGSGFSRGRGVVGLGSLTVGPFSDEWAGRLKRAEIKDWVDVRARARRWEFLLALDLSLLSLSMRRLCVEQPHVTEQNADLLVLGGLDRCVVESGQKTSIDLGRLTSLEVVGGADHQ
jgi:hypothetical protein